MRHFTRKNFVSSTLLVLVLASAAPSLADVRASLGQGQVAIGDSFTLDLSVSGHSIDAVPDLSPLQKDFTVVGTSQSSKTSVVNGAVSRSLGWAITLSPKSTGKAVIPALTVGSESSQPISIDVVDAANLPRADLGSPGLQVDVTVPDGTYYVQQEIPVTVRVMVADELRNAHLSEPSSPDVIVRQTGNDKTYSQTVAGRPVTVIERTYLVTPQKSGELTLPPVTLRGYVDDPDAENSLFGHDDPFEEMRQIFGNSGFGSSFFDEFMNRGREVSARSQAISLKIEARPGAQANWFLPAKNVELVSQWQPEEPSFRFGEATSRTVQLVAHGASKEQLPDLTFVESEGVSIYIDRVDDRTIETEDGSAAVKQYNLSVVPTRDGAVILPAIELEWFDTATSERKVATIAAETIQVTGGSAAQSNSVAPAAAKFGATDKVPEPAQTGSANSESIVRQITTYGSLALPLVGAAGFFFWRRAAGKGNPEERRGGNRKIERPARGSAASAQNGGKNMDIAASALRAACRRSDAASAYSNLRKWCAAGGKNPQYATLQSAPAFLAAVSELEGCLYAEDKSDLWDGRPLLKAFDELSKRMSEPSGRAANIGKLPPLYADRFDVRGDKHA